MMITPMKPLELIGETITPNGDDLKLVRHTNEYIILANGKSLMSSRMHGSEEALATLACRRVGTLNEPCVLVQTVTWPSEFHMAVALCGSMYP